MIYSGNIFCCKICSLILLKAHLRQEASLTKSLDETLSKFVQQQQETLQIAAAHYRERGRTPENFSRQKMSGKPLVRSLSENSPRQNAIPIIRLALLFCWAILVLSPQGLNKIVKNSEKINC